MRGVAAAGAALLISAVGAQAEVTAPSEVVFEDWAVAQSLTGEPGDPAKGRQWFANRRLGNCLACHMNGELADESFHGEIGPPLDGVADRWSEGELRAIVANSKMVFPDTIMPAFYRDSGFNRPLKGFEGKSILTADQVEDVVAYLLTLKE